MAAGNRTSLGFGTIIAFHFCVLGVAVLIQNLHKRYDGASFGTWLGIIIGLGIAGIWVGRRFLWDMFRGFKCAAVLITLLVISCILGTLFIQDLDLRRANIFNEGRAEPPPAGTPDDELWRYEYPQFDLNTQSGRFSYAQTFGLLHLSPSEERVKQTEAKVKLSPVEEQRVRLRTEAYGERAGNAYREAVLNSKRRSVNEVTAKDYARRNFTSKAYARKRWPNAKELGWFENFGLYDMWTLAGVLHLFDIFESLWFYFLLAMIAINVTVGTIVRAPWNMRDIGVAITHAGILTILTGALLDVLVAKEGYMYFTYGKPALQSSAQIFDAKTQTYTPLPFTVQLDRFATEYYHELLVEVYDWTRGPDGKPRGDGDSPRGNSPFSVGQTFPVRTKVPRLFKDGTVKVTVHDYKQRVFVKTVVEDDGTGQHNPAIKIGLYNDPRGGRNFFVHGNTDPWLFAADRRRDALQRFDSSFEYVWAKNEKEYRNLLKQPPEPFNGHLVMRTSEEVQRVPVRLGRAAKVSIADRDVEIEFRSIKSGLDKMPGNVNLDMNAQSSADMWLFLRIDGQELPVPRDDAQFTRDFRILKGVELRFDYPDTHDKGVEYLFRIVEGDGLARVLVQLTADGSADVKPIRDGAPVALIAEKLRGGYLGVEAQVMSARERRDIVDVTDKEFLREGGGREDDLLAAWADVEIEGPWGKERRELTPYDAPIYYGRDQSGRPAFAFGLVKTQQARDWFSVLSVVDGAGNKIKSHTVQVNSPLRHKGWRFFQATAATDRDGLGVSGISVTKNPGVNFMYLGYTVLTLGVCWIFFLKPVLDQRRRRKARAQREAKA